MRISKYGFPAVNQVKEPEYRSYSLAIDKKQILIGMLVWAVLFLIAFQQDFQILGSVPAYIWLILMRVGYFGFTLMLAWLLMLHVHEYKTFDRLVLLWGILSLLASVAVYEIAPRTDIGRFLVDMVAILSLYICVPNNLLNRFIPAIAFSSYDIYQFLANRHLYSYQAAGPVLFSFAALNIIGILYSLHMFSVQRHQFLAHLEEKTVRNELLHLASTDSLTGVFNRRRFMELSGEAWYRFQRYDRPFSVMLMDLDGFKFVNDTFGHQQGDTTLIEFTRMVMVEKRQSDCLGRTGGDEFCLLLPETRQSEAVFIGERIMERCKDIPINHSQALSFQVTVSIGITEVRPADESIDEILSRADTALYESKNAGKNRLNVCSGELSGIVRS